MQSFYKSTLNAFCNILKESTQNILTQDTVLIYNTDNAMDNYMADQNKTFDQLTDEDFDIINSLDASDWEDASNFLKELDKQADAFIIFSWMGLWNGNHKIDPEKETNLIDIIDKLIHGDSIDISLVDGHIEFLGSYTDSSNSYNIYGITQEGEEIFEKCWLEHDMEELALHPEFEEIIDLSKHDQQKRFWEIFMNPENKYVVKLKK